MSATTLDGPPLPGPPSRAALGAHFAPRAADEPYRAERPAFWWLLEREVRRYLKIWHVTVAGQVLSSLLFVVVFGLALGGQLTGPGGVPYKQFILPGLVAQAVMTVGYINGTTSLFQARNDRYIHDVLASPLRWWEINLALVAGGVLRQMLTAGGLLAIAVPLTGSGIHRPELLLPAAAFVMVAAAQIGVLVGSYARSLDDVYSTQTLLVLPLSFLGGVFYSVDRLSQPWRFLSHLNPVYYMCQALRLAILGHADIGAAAALGVTGGLAVALTVWSTQVFRTGGRLKP